MLRTWIWIDVSATCNLQCELCYTIEAQSHRKMSLDTFTRVVDRLLDAALDVQSLHLNWRGEPTSNRRLPEMIAHLATLGIDDRLEWHTNGTLITPDRAAHLVQASCLQTIFVSLDGGNQASFESTRGRGSWDRALAGLEALLQARASSAGPRLGIYQLELGVDPADYDPRFRSLLRRVDVHRRMQPVQPDGGTAGAAGIPNGPCFWLGNALAVDCDGNAFTCLLSSGTQLGSLLDTPAQTLLARAGMLRQLVAVSGRRTIIGCRRCRKCEGSAEPR